MHCGASRPTRQKQTDLFRDTELRLVIIGLRRTWSMNYQLSFCTADRISNRALFKKKKSQISEEWPLARARCFFRNASARFQAPEFDCEIILSDWRKHLLDDAPNKEKKSTGHLGQQSPAVETQFLWIAEFFSQTLFSCWWRWTSKIVSLVLLWHSSKWKKEELGPSRRLGLKTSLRREV